MPSIYLHIPFCKQACHYCDFHFSTKRDKQSEMIGAIGRELVMRRDEIGNETVDTIYFGGGTPSLLEEHELTQLLDTIDANFGLAQAPEITLEANPDDLSDSNLRAMRRAGVNRLSIGIQSFHDRDLSLMNRAHNAREAQESLQNALVYFDNISIDLIYGIPGLSMEDWAENLQRALSFKVPHISAYALTVEPGTALQRFIEKKMVSPVEDEVAERHFRYMSAQLEKEGFIQYELSNFGKQGYFSKNNTAYWTGKSYLGAGPSAHSYDGRFRRWNLRNNPKYLRAIASGSLPYEEEILSKKDRYNEYVMTGLRTMWGVSLERVEEQFGLKYYEYLLRQSVKFREEGLLKINNNILLVTDQGRFLTDGISSDLFMIKPD